MTQKTQEIPLSHKLSFMFNLGFVLYIKFFIVPHYYALLFMGVLKSFSSTMNIQNVFYLSFFDLLNMYETSIVHW